MLKSCGGTYCITQPPCKGSARGYWTCESQRYEIRVPHQSLETCTAVVSPPLVVVAALEQALPKFPASVNITCDEREGRGPRAKGNAKEAAKLMDLYPTYVYNLLEKLQLTHLRNRQQPVPHCSL